MGQPQTQQPYHQQQPQVINQPLGEAVGAMTQPPPAPTKLPGFWCYRLPSSVTVSTEWKGIPGPSGGQADSPDLTYGMREPKSGELKDLTRSGVDFESGTRRFIVMIGGRRTGDYTEVEQWWARINSKAQVLVVNEFMKTFTPTEEEGNALASSRTWTE